jgi:hypothetical protein
MTENDSFFLSLGSKDLSVDSNKKSHAEASKTEVIPAYLTSMRKNEERVLKRFMQGVRETPPIEEAYSIKIDDNDHRDGLGILPGQIDTLLQRLGYGPKKEVGDGPQPDKAEVKKLASELGYVLFSCGDEYLLSIKPDYSDRKPGGLIAFGETDDRFSGTLAGAMAFLQEEKRKKEGIEQSEE